MTRRILIHPGYPKCASSALQKQLFLTEHNFATPWPSEGNIAVETFCWTNPIRFDPEKARQQFFDALADSSSTDWAVISHEILIGGPVQRQYWAFEAAQKMSKTFPEAKILFCFREQRSFLHSSWTEYVRRGSVWGIETFAPLIRNVPGYRSIVPDAYLHYDETISYYAELFRKENVLCIPLELLMTDSGRFFEFIADFLENDHIKNIDFKRLYPGLGGVTIMLHRLINHFFPLGPFGHGLGQRSHFLSSAVRLMERRLPNRLQRYMRDREKTKIFEALGDHYAESNKKLQSFTSVDLASLGYPVSEL